MIDGGVLKNRALIGVVAVCVVILGSMRLTTTPPPRPSQPAAGPTMTGSIPAIPEIAETPAGVQTEAPPTGPGATTAKAARPVVSHPGAIVPPEALPALDDNAVLLWNAATLQAIRTNRIGPPMVSRALAIVHTCIYDAWAAYDATAVGTRLGGSLRRPPSERTIANVTEATSYAAYRAAAELFPASRQPIFDPLMSKLGLDPRNLTTDTSTPAGIGNQACGAVLDFRHRDGSNQLGDHPGGRPGVPYSDYSGYAPKNAPMDVRSSMDRSSVRDPNRWQPLVFHDGRSLVTQGFLAPYWNRVLPFALTTSTEMRSPNPPPRHDSPQAAKQDLDLLEISANLTDEQKMISEYWSDGPASETPPGHWNLFAQYVSRRDKHGPSLLGLATDAKMFFALNNAIFDAGIVAWDNKIGFDSVRPITSIRYRFHGLEVRAWGGPGRGTAIISGEDWMPYQPATFPSPPFAEYSSGHSNFSAAAASVLKQFTNSDAFGLSVKFRPGSSLIEAGSTPRAEVTLSWATFSDAAAQAGLSRRYGGIHFEAGDLDARLSGQRCGELAWAKALTYFNGTAR